MISGGPQDGDGAWRPAAEINVTPLVDVMLVLLVIFMVTAPLLTAGVPVELPKVTAAPLERTRDPVIVTLDAAGRTWLGETELAEGSLGSELARLAAEDADATVYVRGDRTVDYGDVMALMGTISQAGFARVSLLAEARPAPGG